jgi:hypothetical protein
MPQRVTFNGPLAWSLTAIGLVAIALIFWVFPILAAIFAPGAGVEEVGERFAVLMEEHEADQATYRDRFNGRSIFFTPRQQRRSEPVVVKPRDPEPDPGPPPEPPPPATYNGPSIRAIIGDEVWFHGELRLSPGEEGDGVKVVSVDSPWSAKLQYGGGEYDVSLFERGTEALFGGSAVASADPSGLVEVTPEAPPELGGGDDPPIDPGGEANPPAGGGDDDGGGNDEGGREPDPSSKASQQGGESPEPVKPASAPVRSTSSEP